jgi:transposase-like protein/IS1 family transposase
MPSRDDCRNHHSSRLLRHQLRRRRRYRCRTCGKTFCSNARTPYNRLQHRRATFDEVAALSVEGLNKSAIARVKQIAWNTVARWLEKAAHSCRRFNDRRIITLAVAELQADEIRTIVGSKEHPIWIFTTIDVWSRLWPATIVGRRSYRNTLALFQDVASRMNFERVPLIATDGFEFYKRVVRRIFGPACLYGQVIKTRRNDRIIKVERRTLIGDKRRFEETLRDSEDSSKLNTSFVERLNLTIRQARPIFLGGRSATPAGRSVSKITWSCFAATTTSSGLTGR